MNSERKTVFKEVDTLDLDLDGYLLKNVIKDLTELLEKYGDDVQISKESYQYEDGNYFALMKPTPETDQELNERLRRENQYKQMREQHERAEFERLQKKFSQ